ncbi:MAG TPA: YCF48-related protein, partial [Candidatus Acidoferrales bacterium]|nr:YCF48-related protein [Candidatus Acidoferrales bacterium]
MKRASRFLIGLAALSGIMGCHPEEVVPPLPTRLISIADKFFDVQAIDADHAVVVGYGGKILLTSDGGFTWTQPKSGTVGALYKVHFVDANNGWISGQDGIILHSTDGGKTWSKQSSGTNVYLFSLSFIDADHGWAVGDKSIALQTNDGGTHWMLRK